MSSDRFWSELAACNAAREQGRGKLTKAAAEGAERSRLELLMRMMPAPARTDILTDTGFSPDSWWRWCRQPLTVPPHVLTAVIAWWERETGHAIPANDLWQTVPAKAA